MTVPISRTSGTDPPLPHYVHQVPAPFPAGAEVQEDMMRKLFAILALTTTLFAAAACNTVRGAGQDAESAANAVDNEM